MEDARSNLMCEVAEKEEHRAKVDLWKYFGGHVTIMVLRCAIELGIADAIENHGGPMTLLELSSALGCDPSLLERVMRSLVHFKIFKEKPTLTNPSQSLSAGRTIGYAQTPLSKRLLGPGENNMAAMILLVSSPVIMAPMQGLSALLRGKNSSTNVPAVVEEEHGGDLWSFVAANPHQNKLFNESMACDSKLVVPIVIESCSELFQGVETIVDVGGGDGTTLRLVVDACSWIQGICFDRPNVVAVALQYDRIQMVGGDFFDSIPKADAVILKWILHDWGDEDCIKILKKCREAIPNDKGKVIIIDSVIDQDDKEDILREARLIGDITMMANTNGGKERTLKQWEYILEEAGFSRHTITPIRAVQSVIQAFP